MVVERGQVAWVGSEGAADAFADGVDEVVDLDGALVTPAFTDAHVHTTVHRPRAHRPRPVRRALPGRGPRPRTGLRRRPPARPRAARPRLGRRPLARRPPPDARGTGRGHRRPPALPLPHRRPLGGRHHGPARPGPRHPHGARRTGRPADRRRPPRRTRRRARQPSPRPSAPRPSAPPSRTPPPSASARSTSAPGPEISSEDDFTGLLRLAAEEPGPRVVGYWAEQDVDKVAASWARVGAAGDLFVDGALGSHTACLHEPYSRRRPHRHRLPGRRRRRRARHRRAPRRASRRASTPSATPP